MIINTNQTPILLSFDFVKHEHVIEERVPIHIGVQTKPRCYLYFILFSNHQYKSNYHFEFTASLVPFLDSLVLILALKLL